MVNDTTLLLDLDGVSGMRVERCEDGGRRVHLATVDASARACPACQVTCWNSWMRWSLFSLIAAAVLALTATAVHDAAEDEPALVPLSSPELIRLLRALVLPPPVRDREHVLHWTAWRRHHQAVATACHRQRHHRHDQP